jgi:hypothetical protein
MDYGERKKRKPTRQERLVRWAGLAVMAAIAAATLVGMWVQRMSRQAGELPYWTVGGPPCPLAAAAPAPAPGITFNYADVDFARTYGAVSCALIPKAGTLGLITYPVCQFTSPDVLKVTAAGKDAYFKTGPGAPATVSVQGGRITCVLAGNFR